MFTGRMLASSSLLVRVDIAAEYSGRSGIRGTHWCSTPPSDGRPQKAIYISNTAGLMKEETTRIWWGNGAHRPADV